MEETTNKKGIVERIARIWTFVNLVTIALIVAIEAIFPNSNNPEIIPFEEYLLLVFFPFGVLVGELLAFKWALVGGLLSLTSFLGFLLYFQQLRGEMFNIIPLMIFAIFLIPAFLFIYTGIQRRRKQAI